MDSNTPLPFDGLVNAAFVVVIVALVSAIAICLARINYLPHRVPELSELSGEQIKRRKTIYELTQWASGIALVIAGSLLVKSCE